MKRFAQIIDNKVFYIYIEESRPPFPEDILLIDVTDKPEVQQGWDYDIKTGEFTVPTIPEPTPIEPQIDEIQAKILINTETLLAMKELEV